MRAYCSHVGKAADSTGAHEPRVRVPLIRRAVVHQQKVRVARLECRARTRPTLAQVRLPRILNLDGLLDGHTLFDGGTVQPLDALLLAAAHAHS